VPQETLEISPLGGPLIDSYGIPLPGSIGASSIDSYGVPLSDVTDDVQARSFDTSNVEKLEAVLGEETSKHHQTDRWVITSILTIA
jgi:hypothetical protein